MSSKSEYKSKCSYGPNCKNLLIGVCKYHHTPEEYMNVIKKINSDKQKFTKKEIPVYDFINFPDINPTNDKQLLVKKLDSLVDKYKKINADKKLLNAEILDILPSCKTHNIDLHMFFGNIIYEKVLYITNDNNKTSKLTGMMIDKNVFNDGEILNTIMDESVFMKILMDGMTLLD